MSQLIMAFFFMFSSISGCWSWVTYQVWPGIVFNPNLRSNSCWNCHAGTVSLYSFLWSTPVNRSQEHQVKISTGRNSLVLQDKLYKGQYKYDDIKHLTDELCDVRRRWMRRSSISWVVQGCFDCRTEWAAESYERKFLHCGYGEPLNTHETAC